MPCVLPVLSLKVLVFAKREWIAKVLALGALYSLGVVVGFLPLAGLLLFLRSGGETLGWDSICSRRAWWRCFPC
ncbi:MAG: hypothetical protein IPN71_09700 [Fibrobacteres bacterium]|nr:hypothetical protein [Fibrobacterota bacterium]